MSDDQTGSYPSDPTETPTPKPKRLWLRGTIIGVVAFIVGTALGAATNTEQQSELDETRAELAAATEERDELADRVASITEERDTLAEQAEQADAEAAADEQAESEAQARAEELDDREAELDERAAELDEREAAIADAEAEVEAEAANTMPGDGIFIVGEDIEPGEYVTVGPVDDGFGACYWARLSDTSGDFEDIITNGTPTGQEVVNISADDYAFETTGCQEWERR